MDVTTDPRLALANLPGALGLLTALAYGRIDHVQSDLDRLLDREGRAEGLIKALCLLLINEMQTPEILQQALRDNAVKWHESADAVTGERMVETARQVELSNEMCSCKHLAYQHGGHLSWPFWEVDSQTVDACDVPECDCEEFDAREASNSF